VERIAKLGGMVAPILNQGDIAGLRRRYAGADRQGPQPYCRIEHFLGPGLFYAVAKTGDKRGVAIGSDINGAAGLPEPRFGTYAGFITHADASRVTQRRAEIRAPDQRRGLRRAAPRSPLVPLR